MEVFTNTLVAPGREQASRTGQNVFVRILFHKTSYDLNIFNDSFKKYLLSNYFQSDALAWKLHFL